MTITYSLDVAKTTFCGFTKLLARWKGSIYKILWKEFTIFCIGYAFISLMYRKFLNEHQKEIFERVVIFVETFTDLIPLSFVLGFYVSLVVGRWWGQYEAIPWPDRACFKIASYVHGLDERSRMIRRTLGRYVILLQALIFQAVSTSVKRRFPTLKHFVAAGIMTKEEQSVYEKVACEYGKWWLPCHWFNCLAIRAKKEGRIKDSILLDSLIQEMLNYRNSCAIMFGYDRVNVPLVYTQVVTIATYAYSVALMIGRQYLDPRKGYPQHDMDFYIPLFTLLQFFFYVGWLKVAEQILNPYGEDDDDFELNWFIDRTVNMVYLTVDGLHMKHPKVRRDSFWDVADPQLPQTKESFRSHLNPQLGSAFNLEVEDAEYLPLEALLEQDQEENIYSENSIKKRKVEGVRSSFLRRVLSTGLGQSLRRISTRKKCAVRNSSHSEGYSNTGFMEDIENPSETEKRFSPAVNRKSKLRKLVKKVSPPVSGLSKSYLLPTSLDLSKLQDYEEHTLPNGVTFDSEMCTMYTGAPASRTVSAPAKASSVNANTMVEKNDTLEPEPGEQMPSIMEEPSRSASLASTNGIVAGAESQTSDKLASVKKLVEEASSVLQELNRTISGEECKSSSDQKEYESCCSMDNISSSDESTNESNDKKQKGPESGIVSYVVEETNAKEASKHEEKPSA